MIDVPDIKLSDGSNAKWIQPIAVAKATRQSIELEIPLGKICHTHWKMIDDAAMEEREETAEAELGLDLQPSPELAAVLGEENEEGEKTPPDTDSQG